MPKTKISEYSATANSNTDVASINIDEGCAPSGINNAIRAVMGHLKDFQAGTNGDSFNGPIGSTTPAAGTFTSLSDSGNLTFTGTGNRITGDFSNSTLSSRVGFKTSTVNGLTQVLSFPNGTSKVSGFVAMTGETANESYVGFYTGAGGTEGRFISSRQGTGAFLPITFYTSDIERINIGATGGIKWLQQNEGAFAAGQWSRDANWGSYYKAPASGALGDIVFISANGTVGWKVSDNGVGYPTGIGSGGTVTQTTSKSTAVTLNKPTGQITMNNAALAAGANVVFAVNNSLCGGADVVVLTPTGSANYSVEPLFAGSGQFGIRVTNMSGGSLSDALVINFALIKGTTN